MRKAICSAVRADPGTVHGEAKVSEPSLERTCMAQFTLLQTEHWTWDAPRGYMSTTLHWLLLHTSCAVCATCSAITGQSFYVRPESHMDLDECIPSKSQVLQ